MGSGLKHFAKKFPYFIFFLICDIFWVVNWIALKPPDSSAIAQSCKYFLPRNIISSWDTRHEISQHIYYLQGDKCSLSFCGRTKVFIWHTNFLETKNYSLFYTLGIGWRKINGDTPGISTARKKGSLPFLNLRKLSSPQWIIIY